MLQTIKEKRLSTTMMVHFLLIAFMYPAYTSSVGSYYSPDFVLGNLFVCGLLVALILERNLQKRKLELWELGILLGLIAFNSVALYVNIQYFGWYMGQVNMTIAILLFLALLFSKEDAGINSEGTVRFVLYATAIMAAIMLIPVFMGYNGSLFDNGVLGWYRDGQPFRIPTHYSGTFAHKSEYSFIMVLFLALSVVYRKQYAKKWMFFASISVFCVGLIVADTRATVLAAMCIFGGWMLDSVLKKAGGFSWKYLLWFVPFVIVGLLLLYKFSKERDIWSLGLRIYIWKGAVAHILDNPWGIGAMCGLQTFPVEGGGNSWGAWNCHNVFLNFMLQFSIPAGLCCIGIFGLTFLAAVWKNRSFLTLGILVALLIPMNMDWCMLLAQVPLTLLLLYFIFFHPKRD